MKSCVVDLIGPWGSFKKNFGLIHCNIEAWECELKVQCCKTRRWWKKAIYFLLGLYYSNFLDGRELKIRDYDFLQKSTVWMGVSRAMSLWMLNKTFNILIVVACLASTVTECYLTAGASTLGIIENCY